jgi:hypothetical protein
MKKEHSKNSYPAGSAGKKGEGVTDMAMKQHGRNLARAMNQRQHGGSRGK